MNSIANYAVFSAASGVFSLFSLFSTSAIAQNSPSEATPSLIERIQQQDSRVKTLRGTLTSAQSNYALEKAQCWLDFSRHEALRNNPTAVPEAAWLKSSSIVSALEKKIPLSADWLDSQLWGNSATTANKLLVEPMRKDLWQQLDTVKASSGMSCSAKAVACAEVMLAQAAHAHNRFDWRYAQPYFGMAEDLVRDAQKQANTCKPS